jgi:hypothetical protein
MDRRRIGADTRVEAITEQPNLIAQRTDPSLPGIYQGEGHVRASQPRPDSTRVTRWADAPRALAGAGARSISRTPGKVAPVFLKLPKFRNVP